MRLGVVGLGRMGNQIVGSLCRDGHEVVAYDPDAQAVAAVTQEYGAQGVATLGAVVTAFAQEQAVVWCMVPSAAFDQELAGWLQTFRPGDIMVDGGNSDFRKTQAHHALAQQHQVELVDVGTSGGIHGYDNGFSMMVGGAEHAVAVLKPALDALSKPRGAWRHFGPSGAGHYVKMVHNAIEYGMMESLAEGYRLLHEGPYEGLDLAGAGEVWQHGSIVQSNLNELTKQALQENPTLDGIEVVVAESGEARWTLEMARERGMPLPAIQASFDVRVASQHGQINYATKLLAAMRNKFGGHQINPNGKG